MPDIALHAELIARGFTATEIARLVRDERLAKLRRGAYALPLPPDSTPSVLHRALISAAVLQVSDHAVVSHISAAILHGLPTWNDQLDRVHITRDRAGGGRIKQDLRVHGTRLAAYETTLVDGLPVTTLARTVLDLACAGALERAVAVGDAALRLGMPPEDLVRLVDEAKGRHGAARARQTAALIDAAAESPGESVSRVRFRRWGLPIPVLQYVVRDVRGTFVARGDMGWPELGTIGEFDGDAKYGPEFLKPGQTAQQAILDEKRREERIRELGWQVVRWSWADLARQQELTDRLRAAFRRGRNLAA